MERKKIGIWGGGKLGIRVAKRLKAVGIDPSDIRVVVRESNRAKVESLGVVAATAEELGPVDLLLVTLKLDAFEKEFRGFSVEGDPQVVSFMAKGSIKTIAEFMHSSRVARMMTNTSCEFGEGFGAWIACVGTSEDDRETLQWLADVLGRHVEAKSEEHIPCATTLSTITGLTCVFIQYLQDGMVATGAPPEYVDMVPDAMKSAIAMVRRLPELIPLEHADGVTSKGGGTEAARKVLESAKLQETIVRAVVAAYDKYVN